MVDFFNDAYSKLRQKISNLKRGKDSLNDVIDHNITLRIVANGKILAFLTTNEANQKYSLTYTQDFLTSGIPPFNLDRGESPEPGRVYESKTLWYAFISRLPNPNRPDFDRAMRDAGLKGEESYLEILGKLSKYSISKSWTIEFSNAA